ncbi:transcriptional regulator [Actinomadura sp. KC216]|uniref:ArsR/SmtB family transcription factor n=1 Tax=Actinomadura sp. KC216 TaxID=2530370 RepID=UPI00104648CE|nr:metalloregulator ArsR/SmtB family transcription factor [Actinomadura sp. KC216]TDB85570.1 transcriptional regulator [Actinomadura sp. KC216]
MTEHDEELLAAVAEPSRRRLLDVLLAKGEATPTALAAELPFTRQAVAKHLAVLQRTGLVTARRDGREVRYTVHPDRLDEAARALAGVAAHWNTRLQRIKALAESAHRNSQREPEPAAQQDEL